MATAYRDASPDPTRAAHIGAVVRAVAAMRAGLARPQPLAELARAAMFDPYHFHKIFRELTALTPGRFLAVLRMAEARRLLLHSALPVADVGARVGYRSPGTFSRQFTRLVDVPPARFRGLARALAGERAGSRPVLPPAEPGPAPMMALSVAPGPGSLIFRCLAGEGSVCPGSGGWTVASGRALVPLPWPPAPGAYAAFVLVVPVGVRLADALVDDLPGSYLIGRARMDVSRDRRPVTVRAALRRPEPIDAPIAALTAPRWPTGYG
ncbi:helix-turn-helix transcriptional regulator [Nucisporomicrobium flavum]|uniref:helix-turn-helix domain-containing protein n=1 Tax=Nucisporomicrobium flavum TaxID=2785915 RepID=UPI0018F60961|nr:AraC family transcriptional regulator [Nucisporomicrobium flavum]